MKKSVLMSIALLIGAMSLCFVSCDREDPINPDEEIVVKEDPYKDWPKLTAFSEEETRVSYDGLVTGDDSKRIFDSHFDAGDKIYLVVNGPNGVAEYEYRYVAKGQPWEAVDNDGAPYDSGSDFEYYAYWNGKNESLLSFFSHTYTMIGEDQLISFFARALRDWSNSVIDIKNQGTLAKFRAQDILTGLGEVKGENSVKFTLYHAMGLACIQKITGGAQTVRSVKILRNDPYYRWVEETTTDKIIGTSESAPHGCWPYDMGTGTEEKYNFWYLWIPPKELEGRAVISSDLKWSREFRVGSRKFARFSLTKSDVEEYYDIRFGDIFYNDGSLSHNGYIYSTSTSSRTPIGMVINTDAESVEAAAIAAIKSSQASFNNVTDANNRGNNNGSGTGFHALVVGLTDAKSGNKTALAWSSPHVTVNSDEYCPSYNLMFSDMSGYTKTHNVANRSDYSQTKFPAFYAALNYTTLGNSITSTGWFLPSSGHWLHLFNTIRNGAELHPYLVSAGLEEMPNRETWEAWVAEAAAGTYTHITPLAGDDAILGQWAVVDILDEYYMNDYLVNAGGDNIKAPGIIFRSSTECSHGYAASFCIGGDTLGELTISNNKQKNTTSQMRVRAMLAF